MLINYGLNEKCSKISVNLNVNNSHLHTYGLQGVGL